MAKIKAPSIEQTIKSMRLKGYVVAEGNHELNIVGLRSKERQANQFDDLIMVFYRRADAWCVNYFPATTDPGLYWLQNPMNAKGTGILKPGQYPNAYKIGLHQGKYEALVQVAPVTAIRDNNRDGNLDVNCGVEESGLFGANIHHASATGESVQVAKWSAMCQVIASATDFDILMGLARAVVATKGNSFTYTLLEESDVYGVMA